MVENMTQTGNPPAGEQRIVVTPPPGLPRQLVVDYIGRCRESARALRTAVQGADYGQAGILGHRLKGTGCSYGFPELTETGAAIERAAQQQAAAELQTALGRLEGYLRAVEVAPV